ncbi:MAG: DUF1616 domain-containing protein [Chloroflexota bacterium]
MDNQPLKTRLGWRHNELLLLLLAGIIFLALVINDSQGSLASPLVILRLALSLFLATFASGYTVQAALFPQRKALRLVERIALSFGISVSILPLLGVILSLLPWKITLWPIIIGLGSIMVVAAVVALHRRSGLPESDQASFTLSLNWWGWWHRQHRTNRLFYFLLVLMLGCIITVVVAILLIPKTGTLLTEFYLLGSENVAETYPNDGIVGQPMAVVLGIMNREGVPAQYSVIIRHDAETLQPLGPLDLGNNERFEKSISFTMQNVGDHQRVEFILEREGYASPYRVLQLWVNVRPAS